MHKSAPRKASKHLDFVGKSYATKDASGDCIIEGYANTVGKDRVGDVVLPTAFDATLPTYLTNPVMLENHDWDKPAGFIMEAKTDEKGLWVRAKVSAARPDLQTMCREGTLRTFSIGYNEVDTDYDDGSKTKVIKELELLEISIVTVPANAEALFGMAGAAPAAAPASETPAADDGEDEPAKSAPKPKYAKALKDFISDVKDAAGKDLSGTEVEAICDYFMTNEEPMTKKELIAILRGEKAAKTGDAPSAGVPAAGAAAGNASAGVTPPAAGGAGASAEAEVPKMLAALSAKLDAIAQGLAQVLEGMKDEASDKPADDAKPADGDKPAEGDKKPGDDKPAEGDDEKAKKPAADKEEDEDDKEMSKDEEEKALAEIAKMEAELEALGAGQE